MLTGTPSPGSAAAPHSWSLWSYTKSWLYLLPPMKEDHLTDMFLSLAPKIFFLSMFNWPHQSVFGVGITTQLVIFGTAVLFFHYFIGTIFLLLFPSSVSSKTPLTIATWNASHFLLSAVSCRGRGAAPLHFLSICLKPTCSLFNPECQDCVLTLKAHTTRAIYQMTLVSDMQNQNPKMYVGSSKQCRLHEVCVICSLTFQH